VIVAHPPPQIRAILRMQGNGTLILIFAGGKGTLKREESLMIKEFMRRAIALGMETSAPAPVDPLPRL